MTPDDARHILWRLDRQDAQLARIEDHAAKTNGRVTALELWKARAEGVLSLAFMSGRPMVTVAGMVAASVITYLLTH